MVCRAASECLRKFAMEFIDLKTQYQRYREEIDGRMRAVMDHGQFIMGPEIAEVEAALALAAGAYYSVQWDA